MKKMKMHLAKALSKIIHWLLYPDYVVNISFIDIDKMYEDMELNRMRIVKYYEDYNSPEVEA